MDEYDKEWLKSKGFSDEDVNRIQLLVDGYPKTRGEVSQENQRIDKAEEAIRKAITQLKALKNDYTTRFEEVDNTFRAFAACSVNAEVNTGRTPKDSGGRNSLIEELEVIQAALKLSVSTKRVYKENDGFRAMSVTSGKQDLIHKLNQIWTSSGKKISTYRESDYMQFISLWLKGSRDNSDSLQREIMRWNSEHSTFSNTPIYWDHGELKDIGDKI